MNTRCVRTRSRVFVRICTRSERVFPASASVDAQRTRADAFLCMCTRNHRVFTVFANARVRVFRARVCKNVQCCEVYKAIRYLAFPSVWISVNASQFRVQCRKPRVRRCSCSREPSATSRRFSALFRENSAKSANGGSLADPRTPPFGFALNASPDATFG